MQRLLVICGPTATGKTSLAITLAKKLNGELVSADSRQVYKGMDIGTGKEWSNEIKIYGYDIADPKKEFSVSQYLKFAKKAIEDINKRNKLPILVGGTGFYIKGVVDGIPTVNVPQNKKLRKILEEKSTESLYEMLSQIDSIKAGSLNSSDKKNPRRLIRAIEVATWMIDSGKKLQITNDKLQISSSILFLGLIASKTTLDKNIDKRVDERIKMGIKKEIENLLKSGVKWEDQSMMSLGYRQWKDYFGTKVSEKDVIEKWKHEEKKYAKRQITWFKKDKRVAWFDITDKNYPKNVEKLVEKWYHQSDTNIRIARE